MDEIDAHRWPEDGLSASQLTEIRKLKARVEAERLPRVLTRPSTPSWDLVVSPMLSGPCSCSSCNMPIGSRLSAPHSRSLPSGPRGTLESLTGWTRGLGGGLDLRRSDSQSDHVDARSWLRFAAQRQPRGGESG